MVVLKLWMGWKIRMGNGLGEEDEEELVERSLEGKQEEKNEELNEQLGSSSSSVNLVLST